MVQDATLSRDIWTAVRTALVAATIQVTDGTVKNATVAAAYNDQKTSSPQIIIYPIDVDESVWKFGSNQGKKFINLPLEIYYSNTLGLDQLDDKVRELIKETEIPGIELVGITSAYSYTNPALVKYHTKLINLTYDRE